MDDGVLLFRIKHDIHIMGVEHFESIDSAPDVNDNQELLFADLEIKDGQSAESMAKEIISDVMVTLHERAALMARYSHLELMVEALEFQKANLVSDIIELNKEIRKIKVMKKNN